MSYKTCIYVRGCVYIFIRPFSWGKSTYSKTAARTILIQIVCWTRMVSPYHFVTYNLNDPVQVYIRHSPSHMQCICLLFNHKLQNMFYITLWWQQLAHPSNAEKGWIFMRLKYIFRAKRFQTINIPILRLTINHICITYTVIFHCLVALSIVK